MEKNREELLNELFRLYRLLEEGIQVQSLIEELEEELFEKYDGKMDGEDD